MALQWSGLWALNQHPIRTSQLLYVSFTFFCDIFFSFFFCYSKSFKTNILIQPTHFIDEETEAQNSCMVFQRGRQRSPAPKGSWFSRPRPVIDEDTSKQKEGNNESAIEVSPRFFQPVPSIENSPRERKAFVLPSPCGSSVKVLVCVWTVKCSMSPIL